MCAHAVSVAVKKMEGVESVDVSLNEGKAVIRLKPGNAVTLAQIRKAVAEKGFTPKEARIEAVGDLHVSKEGELRFAVKGAGESFPVEPTTRAQWRDKAGRDVQVTGVVAAPSSEKDAPRLRLLTVSSQNSQ